MTDSEFNNLMSLQKHFKNGKIELPKAGERGQTLSIISDNSHDEFLLDMDRSSTITLSRKKL